MKKTDSIKLALALGLTALCGVSASSGAVVYSQLSATGLNVSTTTQPTALDDINLPAGSTAVRQELSAITLGYGILPGTTAQTGAIFVDFYDTFTPTATGSVVSDYLGGFGGTTSIIANTGTTTTFRSSGFTNLTTLSAPIFFNDNNFAIVITLTDSTGGFYSTVITPLMSNPGVPTIGTSTTGVYRDTNADSVFQATELNAAVGNLYLSLTTVNAPVPEPSTYALAGLGALAVGTVLVRRRRQHAA